MLSGKKLNPLEKLAYWLLGFTDIENITIRNAVRGFAQRVPAGARLLDAAAGLKPYERFFGHCKYESCDFDHVEEFYGNMDDGRRQNIASRHTYICSLEHIPVPDVAFDYVLCTQWLEHVPDPLATLKELCRVLKPGGELFITVPQGYGIHGEPYNFFYFASFGLEL